MKLTLKLKDMEEVKRFVDITSQYSEDMALVHGRYVVDAKSILGIISMDLNQPVELVCDHVNDNLVNDLKEFLAA
ncbi:MAG TPA: HPr family phosphocarrier protein [Candidatus Alectryocaccomicrobium excrementavium]|uniref:HPr family phosphocarrier protein n=1 Tax=Candidatus Alectryocaccomicrobium excrementavium TaxID=2840668 RepID=A0A9D1G247_9FIRM|nr:HPr family phosphocarrier protein [Candidatus Alectryocaccomicrobium excrementavium]